MLLLSIESLSDRSKKKVGVLVVAHGDSTATSMVSVAKGIIGGRADVTAEYAADC